MKYRTLTERKVTKDLFLIYGPKLQKNFLMHVRNFITYTVVQYLRYRTSASKKIRLLNIQTD
jgi:hypothetical protein